jgi:hypothetical protein
VSGLRQINFLESQVFGEVPVDRQPVDLKLLKPRFTGRKEPAKEANRVARSLLDYDDPIRLDNCVLRRRYSVLCCGLHSGRLASGEELAHPHSGRRPPIMYWNERMTIGLGLIR